MAWAVDGELFSTEIPPVHNIHAGGHFSVGGSLGTMGDPPVAAYGTFIRLGVLVKRELISSTLTY